MSSVQGIDSQRYQVIPRTLIFVRRDDAYLLLKGAPHKKRFANLYNGVGGHVEQGEDVLQAAQRELREETGLAADLWLAGVLLVDVGSSPGVCVFVFGGEVTGGALCASSEGQPAWIPYAEVAGLPSVPDLPILLERVHAMQPAGGRPFSARSFYDEKGRLQVLFSA